MTFRSPRRRAFLILVVLTCFVGLRSLFPTLIRPRVLADNEVSASFYASFDKNILGDEAIGDETPLANQNLKVVREGRKGGAAVLEIGSVLAYDAPGNVYGERGTIGFWWKLDEPLGRTPFSIVRISQVQQANPDYSFIHLFWTGEDLRLRVYDRGGTAHEIVSVSKTEVVSGRWFYLAFTWDEMEGVRLYVDGHESGRELGELHLPRSLDQFGFHTEVLTPQNTRGNERRVFLDELRVFSKALTEIAVQNLSELGSGRAGAMPTIAAQNPDAWNRHWKARLGWTDEQSLPRLGPSSVLLGNGKLGAEKVVSPAQVNFRILPAAQAVNVTGVSRAQIASLYGLKTRLLRGYLPPDQPAWIGVPPELPVKVESTESQPEDSLHYRHLILPPFLRHTAVDAIRLKLSANGNPAELSLNVSIKDPVYPARELFNASARVVPGSKMTFDFPDIVVPVGTPLWITLASDRLDFAKLLTGSEVELQLCPSEGPGAEASRKEYMADRLAWMRDRFRRLSQTSPWKQEDISQKRRQSKAVDELLAVVEDILRVDPNEPSAVAYLGWIKPLSTPPDYKQPVAPSAIPLWAFQQHLILDQLKQYSEWWVKNRAAQAGRPSESLIGDSHLAMNWPGVALLDGPAVRLRDSLFAALRACDSAGLLKMGLGTQRGNPEQVNLQGVNLLCAAVLLDYGNPMWVERLMEATRQLERLSGSNPANHRHLRSTLLSATDLVEDGVYAREDLHSALLWQPALMLAWYNRHPVAIRWLTETCDALLAHWQKDKYPRLAVGIRFFGDEVVRRGLPEPERINLLWGVYRLTGEHKYLWLLNELLKAQNIDLAEDTSGRWLEPLDVEPYSENYPKFRDDIVQWVRERNIWDRNLQDESGMLARQHAFEVTAEKRYVEDYQAALLKHFVQNRIMYTEAEVAPIQMQFPHRALQRSRLGGIAYYPESLFPGHAVSWEGGDGNLAALVVAAGPSSVKFTLFNLAKTLLDVNLRVWDLDNGLYTIVEGTDVLGQGHIDVETTRRTLPLWRGATIPLSLRPQKVTVVEIRQVKKGPSLGEVPDLAAGELTYDRAADRGSLVIHNLGAVAAPPFTLQVENEKRVVLLKKQVEGLAAPLDLAPKAQTIDFSGLRPGASRVLIFRIDPESKIEEATRENNSVRKILN
jgi:concanavalin A-like lectin/glucanase superfamily protein